MDGLGGSEREICMRDKGGGLGWSYLGLMCVHCWGGNRGGGRKGDGEMCEMEG